MRKIKYDYLIFIGRFQPVHKGHIYVIQEALKKSRHVIVMCGSAFQPRSPKNPWTVAERHEMLRLAIADELGMEALHRVILTHCVDYKYNDQKWIREIQKRVNLLTPDHHSKVGIVGHKKDDSSYYLNLFPNWTFEDIASLKPTHATDVRNLYFEGKLDAEVEYLTPSVYKYLSEWERTMDYVDVQEEHEFFKRYKTMWASAPYPVIFSTTDIVLLYSGHILLIKRRTAPGKGCWGLPGGFLGYDESIVDSALRELEEETKIDVPKKILKGSIVGKEIFDHPDRSQRGRTITYAFLIVVEPNPNKRGLPKIKGSDDAERAKWIPLSEIPEMRPKLYEDHADIIDHLTARV